MAHARLAPRRHSFLYPLFFLRLPLSSLFLPGQAFSPWLVIDRPGLFSFHSRDHGPRDGTSLLPWIRARLTEAGLDRADGEVVLQTFPRFLGYVFNPVSFWFCHDRSGALRAVLAEVNNTFGERHCYWIHHPDQRPILNGDVIFAKKVFHVSPFFPVRGDYRFRFQQRGAMYCATVDYLEAGELRLLTRLRGRAVPLTGSALLVAALRFPFMTLMVVLRIHWQALRLALLRAPFHRKPLPPEEEFS